MTRSPREIEKWSKELLKDTPMKVESYHERREREDAHRALPKDRQPFMVIIMGMLDYGVLWIGPEGTEDENDMPPAMLASTAMHLPSGTQKREAQAEREANWWREKIREGMWMLPFTRDPSEHDIQVRQQWDLDALTEAIMQSYR